VLSGVVSALHNTYNTTLASLALPAAVYGGLVYSMDLVQNAETPLGGLAATAATAAFAIPSSYMIYNTAPAVLSNAHSAITSIAAGSYAGTFFPLAATAAGGFLLYQLGKKAYSAIGKAYDHVKNAYTGVKKAILKPFQKLGLFKEKKKEEKKPKPQAGLPPELAAQLAGA
jgi:hypothetical protein